MRLNNFLAARRRRRGFTLLEIAMVLAIAALLVAGMMMFFSTANNAQKANDAVEEIANINQAVHSLYSGQPDYTGLTDVVLGNSSLMPGKWVKGGIGSATGLTGPFGGAVAVTLVGTDQYTIAIANVPNDACTNIVTKDFGTSVVSVQVTGGPLVTGSAYTPADAQGACTGNANTITYQFF